MSRSITRRSNTLLEKKQTNLRLDTGKRIRGTLSLVPGHPSPQTAQLNAKRPPMPVISPRGKGEPMSEEGLASPPVQTLPKKPPFFLPCSEYQYVVPDRGVRRGLENSSHGYWRPKRDTAPTDCYANSIR